VPGQVGKCTAVKGTPHGARTACGAKTDGDACSQQVCDGMTLTTCAGFVGATVVCRTASCGEAKAVSAASCDGAGSCPAPTTTACGGLGCDGAACRTSCSTASDCLDGYQCADAVCKPKTATCTEDGVNVVLTNGSTSRCYPLRCVAGACLEQCSASTDCAGGLVCDLTSKACIAPESAAAAEEGGCAISTTGGHTQASWGVLSLVGLASILARRRR
jgi:hypothetical protein